MCDIGPQCENMKIHDILYLVLSFKNLLRITVLKFCYFNAVCFKHPGVSLFQPATTPSKVDKQLGGPSILANELWHCHMEFLPSVKSICINIFSQCSERCSFQLFSVHQTSLDASKIDTVIYTFDKCASDAVKAIQKGNFDGGIPSLLI